jgi:16S rRNA (guanine527-N7)-methyltransferase
VGFGGGFPILPLAWKLPSSKFVGIESKNKKVEAVKSIAHSIGLQNSKFYAYRIEDVLIDLPVVVTFKAVSRCIECLKNINSSNNDLDVFIYKGPSFITEELPLLNNLQDWNLISYNEVTVPKLDKRYLVYFKKKNNVPRRTNKFIVKLSDIV